MAITGHYIFSGRVPNGSVCLACRAVIPDGNNGRKEAASCFRNGHFTRIQLHRNVVPVDWSRPEWTRFLDDKVENIVVCTIRNDGSPMTHQMPGFLRLKVRLLDGADSPFRTLPFLEDKIVYKRVEDPPFALSNLEETQESMRKDLSLVSTEQWAALAGGRFLYILKRAETDSISPASRRMIMDGFRAIVLSNWLMGTGCLVGDWLPQAPIFAPGAALHGRTTVPRLVSRGCDWILDQFAREATEKLFGAEGSFTQIIRGRDPADAEGLLLFNMLLADHLRHFLRDRRRDGNKYTEGESVEVVMRSVNLVASLIQDWGRQLSSSQFSTRTTELHANLVADREAAAKATEEDWNAFWEMPAVFCVNWNEANWKPVTTYLHVQPEIL
ncbi:hypothetical protein GQ53DRAFT_810999 [Thozetella sp. PMI_491]|nr:hypothetical protein GQ53DRAFT_810999 [Thozetella sp. PMI_491]